MYLSKYISSIILLAIIFCMMGLALFSDGGILLLDYIATPDATIPWLQNGWFLIPQIPVNILGYEWGTKLSFFLILCLSGYLGVLFARKISEKYTLPNRTLIEICGWGFFLMNPFLYERMMVQPVIYLGIVLLGYSVYFLIFSHFSFFWRFLLVWLCAGLGLNLFLHASYMIFFIFWLYALFFLRSKGDIWGLIFAGVVVVLLNLNWLLAPLFWVQNSVASISSFSPANLEAFITSRLSPLDAWGTNLLLYGFWGEKYGSHYANVEILSKLWYVAGFFLLFLMIIGIVSLWKKWEKKWVWFLISLWFFSLIFGIGIASPITKNLTLWMIDHIPLWQGYREPQKWIGLLMIIEGIFFISWVLAILERWWRDRVVAYSFLWSILLLVLIWSPGSLMGYHGQLRTTVYPQEFASLRESLIKENYSGTILALPWHSYIGCSWMGRPVISNPIRWLLSPLSVISSDNIEVANILYTNSQDLRSMKIEWFLKHHDPTELKGLGITDVLLMKECASSLDYQWLESVPECHKKYDNQFLSSYQCL